MSENNASTNSSTNEAAKRFEGNGVLFKAKLIGMEDVQIDRDEKVCLDSMFKLKAVARARGEHKQRIQMNLTLQAVKIIDEQTKTQVANHEVERISFVVLDPRDNRAFGYVYNTTDNRRQFWAIKTERTAAMTVITLKELFDLAFEQFSQAEQKNKSPTDQIPSETLKNDQSEDAKQPATINSPTAEVTYPVITPPPTNTNTDASKPTPANPIVDLFDFSAPLPVVTPPPPEPKKEATLDDLFGDLTVPVVPVVPFVPVVNNPTVPVVFPPVVTQPVLPSPFIQTVPNPNIYANYPQAVGFPTATPPTVPTAQPFGADLFAASQQAHVFANTTATVNPVTAQPPIVNTVQQTADLVSSVGSLSLSSSFDSSLSTNATPPPTVTSLSSPFSDIDPFNLLSGPTNRTTKDAFFTSVPQQKTIQQLQTEKNP